MSTTSMSLQAGASIQRAQTLFLRTLSPSWLQSELRMNMMRVWRTQLANLCLQVGFRLLDTTQWASSLNDVEHICSEDSLEAKRKRLKYALSQDASAAVESGYDASAMISPELCSSSGASKAGLQVITAPQENQSVVSQERFENLDGSVARESETNPGSQRKFTFDEFQLGSSIHEVSSFASLAALLTTPNASRRQSRAGSEICDDFLSSNTGLGEGVLYEEKVATSYKPNAKQAIDGVIDSVVEEAFAGGEDHGKFLQKVSEFLADTSFEHVDLWVPTERNGAGMANSQLRLTNAGHATVRSNKVPSHVTKRLNEFGVYSTSFSFPPGFGLPGSVFTANQPMWMGKLNQAKPEQFSRVGGAKVYGVNTAVGLPVPSSIGSIVVVLYSTSELSRDANLEARCMEYFHQLRPTPKWRLCIDIANSETETPTSFQLPGRACAPSNAPASIVPSSPMSDLTENVPNEQSLALLLGKYDPGQQGGAQVSNSMSLRLLLLRHPSCRTTAETSHICTILSKYRSYACSKFSESDIARLIASDWHSLVVGSIAPVSIPNHSRMKSIDSYEANAPGPDDFNWTQSFNEGDASNCNLKKTRLEPRVISDPTFQVQDSSPSLSPANFDA